MFCVESSLYFVNILRLSYIQPWCFKTTSYSYHSVCTLRQVLRSYDLHDLHSHQKFPELPGSNLLYLAGILAGITRIARNYLDCIPLSGGLWKFPVWGIFFSGKILISHLEKSPSPPWSLNFFKGGTFLLICIQGGTSPRFSRVGGTYRNPPS